MHPMVARDGNYVFKDRRSSLLIKHHLLSHTISPLLFIFSPVFIFSCTSTYGSAGYENTGHARPETEIRFNDTGNVLDREYTADIFVFNDDRLQRLDSYQRIICGSGEIPFAASQNGQKIIVAIVNPQSDRYGWSSICSLQALEKEMADLHKESSDQPLMSGWGRTEAGKDPDCEIDLTPLSAEIRLESVRCDFSGKPYKGASLENVKVYLTNVNTSARILQENGFMPEFICNQGGLVDSDVEEFTDPGIVVREIGNISDMQTVYPYIALRCYPNECSEETAGSPFTRLVIEGTVNGQTCFYPVNINRGEDSGNGISRCCRYTYNITVRSSGTSDPDTAVSPADIDIVCNAVPWYETDNDEIIF